MLVEYHITSKSTSSRVIITFSRSRCVANKQSWYIKPRMLHDFYHQSQTSIKTMAPAPNDPVSATTLTPALCGHCPNPATITRSGCNNMQYSSISCQQSDEAQHDTLYGTFQNFQQRPSDDHYRSIYFPLNEMSPRFIWLHFTGTSVRPGARPQ